jgi:hypothetical protein
MLSYRYMQVDQSGIVSMLLSRCVQQVDVIMPVFFVAALQQSS